MLSPLSQDCHLPEINQDSTLAASYVDQDDTEPEINQDSRFSLSQFNQDSRQADSRLSAVNLNQDASLNSRFHDFSSSVEDQYSLDSSRLSGAAHFSGVSMGGSHFSSFYSDLPPFEPDYYVALHNRVYSLGQPIFLGAFVCALFVKSCFVVVVTNQVFQQGSL